ncbi:putative alpha/beta hydrolase [Rhexocercosporidium sp. MPI-PUGE-AT-0058]|nr:putative alpha/beta hydrolase [Rhexocercosporidium sp. MPI-PUGE-AT-0058]
MGEFKVTEDAFTLPDGLQAYRKTWTPSKPPVAILIHVHGFSEHMNRYYDFFPTLGSRGILCTGIDQRGWGQTARNKSDQGNAGTTETVLSDLASLFESYLSSSTPVFIMGHSMGGAEILTMASTPKYQSLISRVSGILLESPYIALVPAREPFAITRLLGRLIGAIFPRQQIVNKPPIECVVNDPVVQDDITNDPLCHSTGTLEMFNNMLRRGTDLQAGNLVLNEGVKALWLSHGTGDRLTSCEASREWFEREGRKVKDSEFKAYEGWSHQLHIDTPEHQPVYAKDVGDWILARVGVKE